MMKDCNTTEYCCEVISEKRFGVPVVHGEISMVLKDLGPEPITITSRKQLKEECIKHGVEIDKFKGEIKSCT